MIGKTNSFSSSQGGVQVPLDPPSNLVVKAANAKASFTWTDPLDKYAISSGEDPGEDGQLVS